MKHKELKVGDKRQEGDEVQRTVVYGRLGPRGCGDDKDFTNWQPVRLVGEVILPVDLIVSRFRRPL